MAPTETNLETLKCARRKANGADDASRPSSESEPPAHLSNLKQHMENAKLVVEDELCRPVHRTLLSPRDPLGAQGFLCGQIRIPLTTLFSYLIITARKWGPTKVGSTTTVRRRKVECELDTATRKQSTCGLVW